ncbi:hypothetical protein CALCODRAFT_277227 [Calocera cornea HHB12733]|uniref:Uncharacterized protein n=1 Tax=Calocera cornea HHB12733 TaxID=1353952 RepID=A0A165JP57_9BASI|nr:hypothetical protein CALCODRAFT_277227 [Calocera cornea HHB12733]
MELEKAWEGQRRGSASSLLPSETLSQTSLGSFGFSVPQHISTPSKNPFRAHVFSVAFEDEDDLDFDLDGSTLPSQGSAVAVRLGGLAKPTIHPPRSPSPLSPSNPTASHTAPLSRLPTSRLIIPSRNVSIVPSSQTQPLSPLSPPLRSNVIIPSSQTQPISSLSPVSSRTSNIIPSSQTQAIQPLSPCSQSQLSRFQASPRTMTRALIPSSQAMENIDLLAATELDGSPVLDHIILPPVDQTHSTNPTAPIQPKATQSLSRHPSSETSYYGDSVAFTMPPSIPDSALLMSGSEPDRACEITHELVDSSLAQKLFKRLDTDPAMIDPAFLDSELADTGPPAIQSDPAAMIEKSAPAPGHAPVFTRPDENATIGFTMPPSIPTDSLAVNLADYLPLLDT